MGLLSRFRRWRTRRRLEREQQRIRLELAQLTLTLGVEVLLVEMTPGRWVISAKGYRPLMSATALGAIDRFRRTRKRTDA